MANSTDSKPVVHTKKHLARLERERLQVRWILGVFVTLLVAVLGIVLWGYVLKPLWQAQQTVAKVGSTSIRVDEWQARVRLQRRQIINQIQMYQQYSQLYGLDLTSQTQQLTATLSDPAALGQTVLDQLVDEQLIRQEAAKRQVTVSTAEVDNSIADSFQYYPNGTPSPTATPTTVKLATLSPDTLALVTITPTPSITPTPENTATPTLDASQTATPTATATATATAGPSPTATATSTPFPTQTPVSLDSYQKSFKTSMDQLNTLGITEADARSLYESTLLRDKLQSVVSTNILWARHILVADEATATSVRQRLAAGEDFAKVAAEVSTDSGTKDKGGDLGWFGTGTMVAEFQTAAFGLKVGEISEPVKSQFGYHIIQLLARASITPATAAAYGMTADAAMKAWLAQARTEYGVTTEPSSYWSELVPNTPALPASSQ